MPNYLFDTKSVQNVAEYENFPTVGYNFTNIIQSRLILDLLTYVNRSSLSQPCVNDSYYIYKLAEPCAHNLEKMSF